MRSSAAAGRRLGGAVAAIQMSRYRVIVTERCTRGLVDSDGTSYVSPPQTEEQARSLIALLARATAGLGRSRAAAPAGRGRPAQHRAERQR